MSEEITVSIDGVEIGTAENVKVQEYAEAIREAFKQIQEPMIVLEKAIRDALEDTLNPNHEVVTKLIGKKSKEEKLPEKLRKGWS